jgi:hypothetical protein
MPLTADLSLYYFVSTGQYRSQTPTARAVPVTGRYSADFMKATGIAEYPYQVLTGFCYGRLRSMKLGRKTPDQDDYAKSDNECAADDQQC